MFSRWIKGIGMKRWFLLAIGVAVIITLLFGFCLWRSGQRDGIAMFNLWVDIVVGIFTIWGLYWAATQFAEAAVRPKLHLLVKGSEDYPPSQVVRSSFARNPPIPVLGSRRRGGRDAHTLWNLYLENENPKAGRYVRAVIRIRATPAPRTFSFKSSDFTTEPSERILRRFERPRTGHISVSVQLADHVVVYEWPVHIGHVFLTWADDVLELPQSIVLEYDVYTLDGASHGELPLLVVWDEGTTP